MPVKLRKPKQRIAGVPEWQVRYLETGEVPPDDDEAVNCFEVIGWQYHGARRDDPALPVWNACRDQILAGWIKRHPGTRPHGWWEFDAPEPGRRKVGGRGTPAHEVLAYQPHFVKGIPDFWITAFDAAYYNGIALDIHGNLIDSRRQDGTLHKPGDFAGVPLDPNAPPLFESQAAYLERLGLLVRGERSRLKATDFKPEPLPREYWPTY